MGAEEVRVVEAFDQASGGGFKFVSFEQYAPDGEHIIARLYFWVCPLCGSRVAQSTPEEPTLTFEDWHIASHREVAQLADRLAALESDDA